MTLTIEFCEARAREAGDEATRASLDNVRERALRSQAAWLAMATRANDIAKARALREFEAQQVRERKDLEDAQSAGDPMESDLGPQ
jgi:hypothetical protein